MSWRHVTIDGQERHLRAWVPDRPDHRDLTFRGTTYRTPQQAGYEIARESTLIEHMPEVKDQGSLGSCVDHAWATAAEFLALKRGLPPVTLSPLFLYYVVRVHIEDSPPTEDSGSSVRSGAKALAQYGCCLESRWPYHVEKYALKPPQEAFDDAERHQALRYYRLSNLDWIRACLTLGYPVVFGFAIPQNFVEETGKTGQLKYPEGGERYLGGHSCIAYGHSDDHDNTDGTRGALLCRNSWGRAWGIDGDFWLPYKMVEDFLVLDPWTLHAAE